MDKPIVVFDFETTGLDTKTARIIEIGAIKYINKMEVSRFSQLVNPQEPISEKITEITGIHSGMLEGMPTVEAVLPSFHEFLKGSVGVAHNARYDVGILYHESKRINITCQHDVICTLKLAKRFLKLDRRSLDSLSKHYNLSFESRHRSIGDSLVTAEVLWKILDEHPELQTMKDFSLYREDMPVERKITPHFK